MKFFHCSHCHQRIFFDNVRCIACGARLGFVPSELQMRSFSSDEAWTRFDSEGPAQRPCANYAEHGVCNWMVAADDPQGLCVSCRTTEIIPALGKPGNRLYWATLEQAKRRLFYTLVELQLPAPDRTTDPAHGLTFRFLEDGGATRRVLTGHDDGVITLNISEANDAERERIRNSMEEPYRTLVGHFRHESGHYYWDRLISNTGWLQEYRTLFGDERLDYGDALKRHYAQPRPDWESEFISTYASSHPWEDWAECWAHYLHMVDGLETAAAWGLRLERASEGSDPVQAHALDDSTIDLDAVLIRQWLPISQFSNAMNRSLGMHDSYPFVVATPVVAKLAFIHRVVGAARRGDMPMNFSNPEAIEPVATGDPSTDGART